MIAVPKPKGGGAHGSSGGGAHAVGGGGSSWLVFCLIYQLRVAKLKYYI